MRTNPAWLACVLACGACFDPTSVDLDTDGSTGADPSAADMPGSDTVDPTNPTDPDSTGPAPDCTTDADCTALDDVCAVGTCAGGTCVAQPADDGTACDDADACTSNDVCSAGACAGAAVECETTDVCRVGQCNPTTGACEQAADATQDGTDCDDGDPCTHDGTCDAGVCAGAADACADLDSECSMGVCAAAGCMAMSLNEGGPCDMANTCATSSCQAGTCTITATLNENVTCDDGSFCTAYERCIAGVCTPGPDAVCPADVGCGAWSCDDVADACVVAPANEGMACNDNISCTLATTCQAGQCSGMGPMAVFADSFANNAQGWVLGPEWEIGPATQTPCDSELGCNEADAAFPGGDPDLDHTPTDDNGVAGAVIGGTINQVIHGFYYLESPPFNGNVAGALTLSFWRWLNSDYTPYMENRVEVWNGMTWVVLWASGPSPAIADAPWSVETPALGWNYQQFDLTAYKNVGMRVRFGFNVGQDGVYPAPSWNVDDVLVAATGCPPGP
jgi:hypothetical protein